MTALGGFKEYNLTDVAFLLTGEGKKGGDDVILASGQTSSLTPNHRIPPGTVVVKKAADSKYYLADDASNGDRNVDFVASITSSGHSDGNGVIKIVGNHGTISVTTTTGSGTEANNATDLNADADFAAHYTASSAGGELTIKANAEGEDEWFYVHTDTMATAGFSEGPANGVQGAYADYRVTTYWADLKDLEGTATDAMVGTLLAGHFDESVLSNLTKEAKAVLQARGSFFE